MKKKFIALATAAMCMAGSVNTAFASVFADINDVPWPGAAQYIDQAESMGLMAGYEENGKKLFKARNNVTYNEAVQLIYAIMSTYNSANKTSASVISKWTSTMQANNIPSWAYECVAYGLENGVLSANDLKIFMANATTQNSARREDVAVIFGKALSKVYQVNNNATVNYADKAEITASSVPYIELLNRLNLMVGDDYNNFNPKKNINRAEMAVLATKTRNELAGTSQTKPTNPVNPSTNEQIVGTVADIDDKSITVETSSGDRKVSLASSVSVMYDGESGKVSDINFGDNVVVVVNDSKVTFITAYPSGQSSSSLRKGEISSISKTRISIKADGKTASYKFDKDYNDVKLTLDGSSSKDIDDLIDLVKDGEIINATITADKDGYVTKIVAETSDESLKGTIETLNKSKITIKNGSKTYSYNLLDDTDDIKVKIDGKTSDYDKLKDRYDDDEEFNATLVLNKNREVTSITAESIEEGLEGSLESLSSLKITIKSGNKSYSYYLIDDTDDIKVTLDGKSSDFDKLRDLYKDDEDITVKLTLDHNDEVTKIEAETESASSTSASGKLYSISSKSIKIETSSGGKKSYDIKSGATVTIDGSSSSLSRLEDRFEDGKEYKVKLTLTNGKVTKIAASLDEDGDDHTGRIERITRSEIRIRTTDGKYKTYLFASAGCDFTIDGKYASVSTAVSKYGDGASSSVKAYVTVNGADRATKVKIETGNSKVDEDEGTLLDLTSSKIKIELSNGDTKRYDLASKCTVTIDGKSSSVSKLADKLDDGDDFEVELTFNSSDDVTKIKASSAKESVSGYLYSLDEDKIMIGDSKSTSTNVGRKYNLAGSVTVVVEGDEMELDSFINKYPGKTYKVKLTRNSSGKVTKIVANEA